MKPGDIIAPGRRRTAVALGSLGVLGALSAGCAALRPTMPPVLHNPAPAPLARRTPSQGFALALSAGSARGFAHIGVLKALEQARLVPDFIIGASAGAIVGALYASGQGVARVEALSALADGVLMGEPDWLGVIRRRSLGLMAGNALHAFINEHIGNRMIEDMPVPLAIVATDLASGAPVAFTRGDAGHAVHASAAIPGAFEPVDIAGRLYADGSMSSPVPVDLARSLGARTVVAVDVIYPPEESGTPRSALDVMFQSFLVQTWRLKLAEVARADLAIHPDIPPTRGQYGFGDRAMLIAAGESAMRKALPELRRLLRA